MRIVDVRPGSEDDDIRAGREILATEIGHPAKTVMVIIGEGPEISAFADRAGTRSDSFGWREAVWVKKPESVLTQQMKDDWFGGAPEACAVLLGMDDQVVSQLGADATLLDIERAFLQAQVG